MRIALTVDPELPVPPLHYGGIERIVDMLARGLAERGHDATLFAHPHSTCPVPKVAWGGQNSRAPIDTLRNAALLTRRVAVGRYDIVHSFSRIAYLAPILPLPIPKLMSYQREISPRTTGLAHRLARSTLEFSAISRSMMERTFLPGRWHLVPNGVPLGTFTFNAAVQPDAPLVFLGRIEEIKGPHLAIEVARQAGRRLVLAGNVPPEHQPWFEVHVTPSIDGDRVRYLGPVDDTEKNALLGGAAALLMPVLWEEPFGIVMAEAMACGTPVLGLRRGSVPEVVADGVTGFAVDTIEEMVAAVGRLPALSRTACRARVERLYSERAITEGYLRLYADLIARVRARPATAAVRSALARGDDRLARVCIVTPGQIGTNPRVVKEADALHEAGRRVSVIATRMLDHVEPRDLALMRRISWRLERIDLRSRPRWKLLRLAQLGVRRAYVATGLARGADVALRAYTWPLRRAALATPADLYVAHYPDALPAAAAAARRYGSLYAYDAEDFHLGDWPDDPAYEIERRLVRAIEARYLPGCAYVTAASPGIADAYAEAYGIERPQVVLNTFPLGRAPAAPTPRGTAQPGPSLYWFSQTIGPDRGLECAVRAVGLARTRPHLYLRGTPAGGFAEALLDLAQSVSAGGQVHLLPPDEPDRMEELAATYDAGLVAETGQTASRRLCLTNKLFSFLLAGIPPVLSDTPAHRSFAAEAGLAELVYPRDDPAALAQLLDRLLGEPARLAAARTHACRLGQERYNWERERVHFIEAVERAALLGVVGHHQTELPAGNGRRANSLSPLAGRGRLPATDA